MENGSGRCRINQIRLMAAENNEYPKITPDFSRFQGEATGA